MKLLRRLLERTKRLIAPARRLIYGIPPVLGYEKGVGGEAARPERPRGPAPRRPGATRRAHSAWHGRSYTERFEPHGDVRPHPGVERLQRRAVNELLEDLWA